MYELDIDEYLVYGMMYTESRFESNLTSSAGAQGILQIMPNTWNFCYETVKDNYNDLSDILKDDPTDTNSNIIISLYYIKYLKESYGFSSTSSNISQILTAYNRGMGGAKEYYQVNGHYTSDYAQNILRAADYIKSHKTWKEGL